MLKRRHQSPTSTFAARVASFSALTIGMWTMAMRNEATQNAIFTFEGRIAETRATHAYFLATARGLQTRLLSLQRQRDSLKNQIAPISSLPNELLSAIFEASHV